MDREGKLYICTLQNTAETGFMPIMTLVPLVSAYYRKRTVGYNRLYAAMGANKEISLLVRCFNTEVPDYNEQLYVVFVDNSNGPLKFEQFRVTAIQEIVEDGAIDLTLSKMGEYYNVELPNDGNNDTN